MILAIVRPPPESASTIEGPEGRWETKSGRRRFAPALPCPDSSRPRGDRLRKNRTRSDRRKPCPQRNLSRAPRAPPLSRSNPTPRKDNSPPPAQNSAKLPNPLPPSPRAETRRSANDGPATGQGGAQRRSMDPIPREPPNLPPAGGRNPLPCDAASDPIPASPRCTDPRDSAEAHASPRHPPNRSAGKRRKCGIDKPKAHPGRTAGRSINRPHAQQERSDAGS